MGQTVTTREVEDLPLDGRTPLMLAQLSIGVLSTSQPSLVHPFDSATPADITIGGTASQTSEILIDGSPDETWDMRWLTALRRLLIAAQAGPQVEPAFDTCEPRQAAPHTCFPAKKLLLAR